MAHVGDKLLPQGLGFFQAAGHVVEGRGQLRHLFPCPVGMNPGREISMGKLLGRIAHFLQGLHLPSGDEHRGNHRHQQHDHRRQQEQPHNAAHHLAHILGGGRHHHIPQQISIAGCVDGQRIEIPLILVDAVQHAGGIDIAVLRQPLHKIYIQVFPHMVTVKFSAGTQHQLPGRIAEHYIRIGNIGAIAHCQLEIPVHGSAQGGLGAGKLCHCGSIGGQSAFFFPEHIVVKQASKAASQQDEAQKDHSRGQSKLSGKRASHEPATSNLYPTPQTVFRSHWSLTPSSFSRSRLICTSTVRLSPK